ncbi:MAG: ammonium transporter, partial [Phycisphaerales bacterium]|nr:ammonium transporter [Phycisphaerales bacterium]
MESEVALTTADALFWVNNTWMLMASFMVFLMHLGFACLEAGLGQAKNTVNILFKNLCVLAIGLLTYAAVGFALMYPGESYAGGVFGFAGFGIGTDASGLGIAYADGHYTYWTDFLFQEMFAATAATIVSGAVAERVRLSAFLAFAAVYVAFCYPIVGMWHWGGGWLKEAAFHDFAGSTIVHSVGGWAALVGALMLGARHNRFSEDTRQHPKMHSLPLAAIGVLLLWFGWYGFNGGSVLSADPAQVSYAVVTTTLAAASGVLVAAMLSWAIEKKPDLSMALNGALAGLVAVTAGADVLTPMASIVVGGIGGALSLVATAALVNMEIDDPVGAVPVHLVCGVWGTLAVGLFVPELSVVSQLVGIGATAAFCVPVSFG